MKCDYLILTTLLTLVFCGPLAAQARPDPTRPDSHGRGAKVPEPITLVLLAATVAGGTVLVRRRNRKS
jgi:hypothetical protein